MHPCESMMPHLRLPIVGAATTTHVGGCIATGTGRHGTHRWAKAVHFSRDIRIGRGIAAPGSRRGRSEAHSRKVAAHLVPIAIM